MLSALATGAVAGASGRQCAGPMGHVNVSGDLVVPAGANCELDNTVIVAGDVQVRPGGSLVATGATIRGSVLSDRARFLALANCSEDDPSCSQPTRIGGAVAVTGTTGTLDGFGVNVICDGTEIRGSLTLIANRGAFVIGDCTPDQSAPIGNHIGGSLRAVANEGLVITKNRIGGSLVCVANDPTPIISGNDVSGHALGQCAS